LCVTFLDKCDNAKKILTNDEIINSNILYL
jgi:hypothetical protein